MKLYAFIPGGHGQCSFYIMSENKDTAKENVQKYIDEHYTENGKLGYGAQGWGTDYYELIEVQPNGVIENAND